MALLEEATRQLYQEWFVRLRFAGHEHTRIVNGVPDGWKECTLGDCFTLKRGYDLPDASRVEGSIPVVSSSGVTGMVVKGLEFVRFLKRLSETAEFKQPKA